MLLKEQLKQAHINSIRENAVIKICIGNEYDLYNKFTVLTDTNDRGENQDTKINSSIIEYLRNEAENIPAKTKLSITITIKEQHHLNSVYIENLIKTAILNKLLHIHIKLRKINFHSILLALAGIISVSFTHILFAGTFTLHELFIVAGWVFIWRAVEIFCFNRFELTAEKANFMKIYNARYILNC